MTVTRTIDDLYDPLSRIAELLRALSAEDPVARGVSERAVEALENDLKRLSEGYYRIVSPIQMLMVINVVYGQVNLVGLDSLNNVRSDGIQIWRIRDYLRELTEQSITSRERGVQGRQLFVVDDWLRFVNSTEVFKFAKQFANSGIAVKVMERIDVTVDLRNELEEDYFICTFATPSSCVVRVQANTRSQEFPVMTVVTSKAYEEIKDRSDDFELLWTSGKAHDFELI